MGQNCEKKSEQKIQMGRLKSLGLSHPFQIPLLLPNSWDDLTRPVGCFATTLPESPTCIVVGHLKEAPSVRFDGAAPRLVGYIHDDQGGRIGFMSFGDTRSLQEALLSRLDRVSLFGQLDVFNGHNWLKGPEIVPENWLGRLRPRYPGKAGVISSDTVRERVLSVLAETIPLASEFLLQELSAFGREARLMELAGHPGESLASILHKAHLPRSLTEGAAAQIALQRLAALGIISKASSRPERRICTTRLDLPDWRARAKAIPFPLTDEQERAVSDALADISSGTPMHRIISGDVGTGKTACFALAAAAVVDAGGTVACMLPNESLAIQVFNEISGWWPDLPVQLLTGSNPDEELCGSMVVGTSALLFRDLGDLDLVIVDELQKASRAQREQMVGPNTHLLEATATCIPRSQALIRYGAVKVSRLTKAHTPKTIHTRIWRRDEWPALFARVQETLSQGDQVLMVYPLREKGEDPVQKPDAAGQGGKKRELRSAGEVFEKWEKMFPGQVRLIHGQMKEEKATVLEDMRAGRAAILCATTAVEVGITIPRLRRVVVVHPERHGASTLHQIRGRLCRNGGEGFFDMFLPHPAKDATLERLQVLVRTTDGFEVATHDMLNRGIGDLSATSDRQSGADMTFLFGKPVAIPILDEMIRRISDLNKGS